MFCGAASCLVVISTASKVVAQQDWEIGLLPIQSSTYGRVPAGEDNASVQVGGLRA